MTPATIDTASKEDLKEEYLKIKAKQKREKEQQKEKASQLIGAGVTIFSGAGVSYLMGTRERDARTAEGFDGLTPEEQKEKIHEATSVAGFDIDLVAGLGLTFLGMSDYSGDYSHVFTGLGVGSLTAFASRLAHSKALEAKEEASE